MKGNEPRRGFRKWGWPLYYLLLLVGIGALIWVGLSRLKPQPPPKAVVSTEEQAVLGTLEQAATALRNEKHDALPGLFDVPPECAPQLIAVFRARARLARSAEAIGKRATERFGEETAARLRARVPDFRLPFEGANVAPAVSVRQTPALATYPGKPPVRLRKLGESWRICLAEAPHTTGAEVSRALVSLGESFDGLAVALDLLAEDIEEKAVGAENLETAFGQYLAVTLAGRSGPIAGAP